jgi:hypothetical protein
MMARNQVDKVCSLQIYQEEEENLGTCQMTRRMNHTIQTNHQMQRKARRNWSCLQKTRRRKVLILKRFSSCAMQKQSEMKHRNGMQKSRDQVAHQGALRPEFQSPVKCLQTSTMGQYKMMEQ